MGTIYTSGLPDADEQVIRLWCYKNNVPLHVAMSLLAQLLLAKSWSDQIFGTSGTEMLGAAMENLVKEHPEFAEIRAKSAVEIISGFRFKPVYKREYEAILAEIEQAKETKKSVDLTQDFVE